MEQMKEEYVRWNRVDRKQWLTCVKNSLQEVRAMFDTRGVWKESIKGFHRKRRTSKSGLIKSNGKGANTKNKKHFEKS